MQMCIMQLYTFLFMCTFCQFFSLIFGPGTLFCVFSVCVECGCCQNTVVSVKDDNKHEHVARRYTIGVHKTLSPSITIACFSVVLLFCLASFVMAFILVEDTKTSLLSERRVIYNHLH